MPTELTNKVVSGVAWSMAEKVGSMLLQLAVSIVVARILTPQDFGLMAILTFFTSIGMTLADSGFSQALIRSVRSSEDDLRTVFAFNLAMAAVLYAAVVLLTPVVASYYSLPQINAVLPVLMLSVPLNALSVVQSSVFQRDLRFPVLSKINFTASLASGITAVAMAVCGFGVWALVGQRLTAISVRVLLQWILGRWRPKGSFRMSSLRSMAPFSLRIMATDVLGSVYSNISQLFIGRMYSPQTLGFFHQGQKIKDLPASSIVQSVQFVTFPALSKLKEQPVKFAESYRKVLAVTSFVVLPVMIGMASVSSDMIELLIGEKWLPTAPYFTVMAAFGAFLPLSMVAMNVLKTKSDGSVIFRLEIAKKAAGALMLVFAIPISPMAVAWGLGAMVVLEMAVNFAASTFFAEISMLGIIRSIFVPLSASVLMFAAVWAMSPYLADMHLLLRLGMKIAAGVIVYILLTCRSEGMTTVLQILKERHLREGK